MLWTKVMLLSFLSVYLLILFIYYYALPLSICNSLAVLYRIEIVVLSSKDHRTSTTTYYVLEKLLVFAIYMYAGRTLLIFMWQTRKLFLIGTGLWQRRPPIPVTNKMLRIRIILSLSILIAITYIAS
jgi:hypothetical protein